MATLIPKFTKTESLSVPSYFFAQIVDVLDEQGEDVSNIKNMLVLDPVFIESKDARSFADKLRLLLDEDKVAVASFPCEWWAKGTARIIVEKDIEPDKIAALANHENRRHIYFGVEDTSTTISPRDIEIEDLPDITEKKMVEVVAFFYTSRGFWVAWA